MTRTPLIERLSGVIAPALDALGVVLWGVELASAGSRMVVRVYIDAAPREAAGDGESDAEPQDAQDGVTIDLCARVSRHLGVALDAEDAVPGAYVLEVSSPGLERRFFSAGQLAAYLGRTVDVRLAQPRDGRRHFRGTLTAAGADDLDIDEGAGAVRVPWAEVKTAHLVHDFPGPAAKA